MPSLKIRHGHVLEAPRPVRDVVRRLAAQALFSASATLARACAQLTRPDVEPAPTVMAELEFFAEAGAPEGALYVNGRLVGWIDGVRRL